MKLKNLIFLSSIALSSAACSSTRHTISPPATTQPPKTDNSQVSFLDNISIQPGKEEVSANSPTSPGSGQGSNLETSVHHNTDNLTTLQFKYSILLNIPVEELTNLKLLQFMDEWYGIGYHYGGDSKDGIDCSAFVCLLMSNVYAVADLPRVSKEQFQKSKRVTRKDLREGDLVFFHTVGRRRGVTHVGVYLTNQKFIHASSSGVMISDLGDAYYGRHYVGAGRVLD